MAEKGFSSVGEYGWTTYDEVKELMKNEFLSDDECLCVIETIDAAVDILSDKLV